MEAELDTRSGSVADFATCEAAEKGCTVEWAEAKLLFVAGLLSPNENLAKGVAPPILPPFARVTPPKIEDVPPEVGVLFRFL
jgi:hypothetical protein